MLTSSRRNSGFIEHLSDFWDKTETIQKLVNAPLDTKNQGEWYRIFDSIDTFHLCSYHPETNELVSTPVMNELVQSYGQVYKAKDQSQHAEKFVRTVLEKYAFPDLSNMDALIKVLGIEEAYARKTQEEKLQIITYITHAYLFYFFSAVFMEFSKRNPNDKNLKPINFEDIQKKLVTVETLKGAANLQTYLKDEEQGYTGFTFAHRCILSLAKEHGLPGWDHELALSRKLLEMVFKAHPKAREKLQACEGAYQLLGDDYLDAFKVLMSAPAPAPENRHGFFLR